MANPNLIVTPLGINRAGRTVGFYGLGGGEIVAGSPVSESITNIKLGSTAFADIYVGSSLIQSIYVGSTKVWDKS